MKKRKKNQPRQWDSKFNEQELTPTQSKMLKGGNGDTTPPPEDTDPIITDDVIDQ